MRGDAKVEHDGDRVGGAGGGCVDDHGPLLIGQPVLQVRVVGEKLLGCLAVGVEASAEEPVNVGAVFSGAEGSQPCCGVVLAGPDCKA